MVRPERDRLSGIVELDQSFLGGKSAGRRGPSSDKAPVMIAVERICAHRLGWIRLRVAKAPGTLELVDFAARSSSRPR